jgi:hypothetical protein
MRSKARVLSRTGILPCLAGAGEATHVLRGNGPRRLPSQVLLSCELLAIASWWYILLAYHRSSTHEANI